MKKKTVQKIRIESRGQDGFGAVLLSRNSKRPEVEVVECRGRTPQEALGELVMLHSNCFEAEVSFTWSASAHCAKDALKMKMGEGS